MKSQLKSIALLTLIIFSLSINTSAQKAVQWKIDKSHSSVNFSINHFFSAVPGKFREFNGNVKFSKNDLKNSSADFTIQVASISTDDDERDKHLQSGDFFDADNFPTITFKSTSFEKTGEDEYLVKGILTMREVSKEVELPMRITGMMDNPWREGSVIMGINIETILDRTEYGVGTGSWAATAIVSDEVRVSINMELDASK